MANPNFDPNIGKDTQFKSGKEAAMNGKKGGEASGESKRAAKRMRELYRIGISLPEKNEKARTTMTQIGWDEEDITQGAIIAQKTITMAKNGNMRAVSEVNKMDDDQKTSAQVVTNNIVAGDTELAAMLNQYINGQ